MSSEPCLEPFKPKIKTHRLWRGLQIKASCNCWWYANAQNETFLWSVASYELSIKPHVFPNHILSPATSNLVLFSFHLSLQLNVVSLWNRFLEWWLRSLGSVSMTTVGCKLHVTNKSPLFFFISSCCPQEATVTHYHGSRSMWYYKKVQATFAVTKLISVTISAIQY